EEAPVLPERQDGTVGERLTEPTGQADAPLRVELIAVRAEQVGHASPPSPPLLATFIPLSLHRVKGSGVKWMNDSRRGSTVEWSGDNAGGAETRGSASYRYGSHSGSRRPIVRRNPSLGGTGRPARRRPTSSISRFSLRELHRRQAATTLSHAWAPPRERGTTCSRFSDR